MKKEIIFAIAIGLVVGLIITFGIYRARQAVTGATTVNNQLNGTLSAPPASPSSSSPVADAFLVSEPINESVVSDAAIRVSGQAFPNAAILILSGNGETVGTADSNGNFSMSLSLQAGANRLEIRALSDTSDPLIVYRTVILSTADLNQNATASATPKPSPTAKPTATPKPTSTPKPTATPKAVTQ